MKWPWQREYRTEEDAAAQKARAEAEARLRAAKRMTGDVAKMAEYWAQLPAEDFADRVSRAFQRRSA